MLMTALNISKDQATSAILEALNEGDEDKETDVSRFQQVRETFPELFERFLEVKQTIEWRQRLITVVTSRHHCTR